MPVAYACSRALAIACSPLDAGQMIDIHDILTADYSTQKLRWMEEFCGTLQ